MATPILKLVPLVRADERGMLLTDASLNVIAYDAGAARILQDSLSATSGNDGEQALKIPEEIRMHLAKSDPGKVASTGIHFRIGKYQYVCRAFLVQPKSGLSHQPMLALYIRRDASDSGLVRQIARKYHLSDRESEALEAIARGQSSKDAARQMRISPNTVKSFMRIIMIKMHVETKAALIAKLLEYYRNGWMDEDEEQKLER